MWSVSFLGLFFFRTVLGSQQDWEGNTDISHYIPIPIHAVPPLSALLKKRYSPEKNFIYFFNQGWTYSGIS